MSGRRIQSRKLLGLVIDHEADLEAAPANSTGILEQHDPFPANVLWSWMIEFECTVCNEKFQTYRSEFHELTREVLNDNNIEANDE